MRGRRRRTRWADLALALGLGLVAAPTEGARAESIADQLAVCKDENDSTQARISACTRAIQQGKDDDDILTEALLQRGVLYELAGDKEAAIGDYSEVIKLDPTSAIAFFNRGNVHDQLGDLDRALADYSEAIKLDPSDPDIYNNRGQVYDAKGDPDAAIADYSQSIRLSRDNSRAFYNRGLAFANKSDYERAVADFNEAIKLDPRDAEAYVSRGAVHEEMGNEAAATIKPAPLVDPFRRAITYLRVSVTDRCDFRCVY